jgi:signal transduction histidine kinase/pSer/pThr/pTyr-binding forkhead associated (FHA) protein
MERWERLKLIVIKGADEGKQFELTSPSISIGRDAVNSIRLNDTEISRRHAELVLRDADGKRYFLRDIGSANGTFVNNEPIAEVALSPGDQIQVGQTVLVVSGGRGVGPPVSDLAEQINLITRQDVELSSAIIKRVGEGEGSRILSHPEQVQGTLANKLLTNLGVLYELTQAVTHTPEIGDLLNRVMELTFQALEADRGCIMLRDPDSGQVHPQAVRWRDRQDTGEKIPISRTIMEYVLSEKEGILVSDVMQDERFNTTQSIVRHGIREVICVPMKGRHETLGVLYLDTHSTPKDIVTAALVSPDPGAAPPTGKFTGDSLSLAIAIAHQAALAVEDTRYHEALVQSERLAAIGQTVAVLSHHIKNILQGLQTGGEIVDDGLAEGKIDLELVRQGWKIVAKNQTKIQDLVKDMLSFSKEREPHLEPVEINGLVRDVVELLKAQAQARNICLETRLGELPVCQADREGIHRALLNIVTNAFDAVDDRKNAKVGIKTSVETGKDTSARFARIEVLDNGVGIPGEDLPNIFKPFQSSKGERGTGLGLAVSRKILREHGGDILVQSVVGKGSRFVLLLPLQTQVSLDQTLTG